MIQSPLPSHPCAALTGQQRWISEAHSCEARTTVSTDWGLPGVGLGVREMDEFGDLDKTFKIKCILFKKWIKLKVKKKKKKQNVGYTLRASPQYRQGPYQGQGNRRAGATCSSTWLWPALVRFSKGLRAGPGVEPTSRICRSSWTKRESICWDDFLMREDGVSVLQWSPLWFLCPDSEFRHWHSFLHQPLQHEMQAQKEGGV